ncbi:hypothetical protein [Hydrogenivirga sp. 128-5-R1-1]|uniref:hypothetical protein n=1 Tax=Hydrogenivirga sp. 128-5-R1-1 TaxID=392423 RepID=UPI00015EF073|nr:hypothetical protein [Hydrogenivirga sp. 128-5-R1-1]EDP74663.1 hypothetical protein HG1285_14664 [Hydrogenivirga sp. 128-5-R1-1]
MIIRGTVFYEGQEYPSTFLVEAGERDERGGVLVLPEETTAPDELVPWSLYLYPGQTKYLVNAGYLGTSIVDVVVEFPAEEIEKVFTLVRGSEQAEQDSQKKKKRPRTGPGR